MADDPKLATALKQAKLAPMYFAFVAKGASDGMLIVAKKKIPVKEINEAKAETGGKKVFKGRCVTEDGTLVFELATEPPSTLAKTLKKVIADNAGLKLDVATRVAADLEEDGEQETDATEAETPEPSAASPTADDGARFAKRLKALAPVLQKAETTGSPIVQQAKAKVGEGNKLYVAKQYAEANAALDQAELLIKQALTAQTTPVPKSPGSNVVYTQTRLAWDQTRKKIQADLQKLEQSILSVCLDPELAQSEFDFSKLASDTKELYTILDKLDERLIDKLDDALNAADPQEKSRLQSEAGKIVKEYLAFVESDDLMSVIDQNGFAPVTVRKSALDALHLLDSKL